MSLPHTLETITKLYSYVYDSMESSKEVNAMLRRRAALSATLAELGLEGRPVKLLFTTAHQCAEIKKVVDLESKLAEDTVAAEKAESFWSKTMFIFVVSVLGWLDYLYVQNGGRADHVILYGLAATGVYSVCCDVAKLGARVWFKRGEVNDANSEKS